MAANLMDLVRGAQAGDRAAVAAVIDGVLPDLRAYVRVSLGAKIRARESAADLVQSVCREVLQDIGAFRGDRDVQFKGWLFSLALNKIRNRNAQMRTQRRDIDREISPTTGHEELLSCYSKIYTPSRIAQAKEEVARVEAAMSELPDDYRDVITKKCILGMSHDEIAQELQRPETAVRKLLSRARAQLSMLIAHAEMENRPGDQAS